MRKLIVVAVLVTLSACRGEPVPRDYQNAPPDVGNAAQTQSQTPSQGATGEAPPQPSSGNEGSVTMPTTDTSTTTMGDTPPTTT